jgi:hypothetical protein
VKHVLLGLVAGPVLLLAAAPPAHTYQPPQTLRLHVVGDSDIRTPRGYIAIDKDYGPSGAQVGSDVTTCRAASRPATTARCGVGVGLADGLLIITFTETEGNPVFRGTVTGGTGTYRHATGTVTGHEEPNGAAVQITLHY